MKKPEILLPPQIRITLSCFDAQTHAVSHPGLTAHNVKKFPSEILLNEQFIRSLWEARISYVYSSLCSKQIFAQEKAISFNFHSSRNPKQCTPQEITLSLVARGCQSLRNLKHTSEKQEDLCLLVSLWNTCFTKIQVIASKSWNATPKTFSNFSTPSHTKDSPQIWRTREIVKN